MSETIALSSFRSKLNRLDFPAFVLPQSTISAPSWYNFSACHDEAKTLRFFIASLNAESSKVSEIFSSSSGYSMPTSIEASTFKSSSFTACISE